MLGNKYTWVECKNQKNNVNLVLVRDFYNKIKDNNQSKDKKFTIPKMIFVARNGFVNNAQDYAHEHNIRFFKKDNNSFVELKQCD